MTDDDLRADLRRADPAAALEPLAPSDVTRLLETTVTRPTTRPATRRRQPLLAAASILVVLGICAAVLILNDQPEPVSQAPVTTTQPSAPSTVPRITRLSVGSAGSGGRCAAPSATQLAASARSAFEGTVERIDAGVVTLRIKHTWRGFAADLIMIGQPEDDNAALLAGVVFKPGETYLIAATDDQIMSCGYSGLASNSELRALYEAAF